MSKESGLATFRDADGLWGDYPVWQVASHDGWLKDPVLVNSFYNGLRRELIKARPNAGHLALAKLQEKYDMQVITQNVDNLHERAGQRKVIHLHGELMRMCSSRDVENPHFWRTLTEDDYMVSPGEKAGDGSLLRPYIVFFQEAVPRMDEAIEAVSGADILVIIGTSLVVYPAASLVQFVKQGTPIYLIDPQDVAISRRLNVTHLKMGASEGVAKLPL